jgi:hypothetical protein
MTDAAPQTANSKVQSSSLLALLTFAFYALFTLLPDSHSLMVAWVWVFLWQVGLICPVLWLLTTMLRGWSWLGNRLDWLTGLLLVGLLLSTALAQFPTQAQWQAWTVVCYLAALYALSRWLEMPQRRSRLLIAQGYLNLAFILLSLTLWLMQTLLPELAQLRSLQALGVNLPLDLSRFEVRNWAPIGHQNYVAGYLVLALPLLLALGIEQTGWRRWLWWGGAGLGLLDLYTTSSRAGWLGVIGLTVVTIALLLWHKAFSRRWIGVGIGILVSLLGLLLVNNRLRSLLQPGGELGYRLITVTTGWRMGLSRMFTGVGLGGVPLLYQKFRPSWAGREAELTYQLHSTPAHLWAELGVWSVVTSLGAIVLLIRLAIRWLRHGSETSPVLIGSLFAGLLAYAIVSLFDYQLDNVCISGTLVIFLAVLSAEFRQPVAANRQIPSPFVPLAGLGILLATIVWLVPIHRAWMLSSQAFTALRQENINAFAQQLQQAHQLAPWEPYYNHQLGWNLGNLSLQTSNPQERQQLVADAIAQFQQGNRTSPFQEFGHTNLAWLVLNQQPQQAMVAFGRSAQLVPAKRGVFFGLGLSLLAQGKSDLAQEAMTLELLRDPVLLTSPVWQLPQLQPLYTAIVPQLERRYTTLLEKFPQAQAQLHPSRGGVRWWVNNLAAARQDFAAVDDRLSLVVIDLAAGKPIQTELAALPTSAGKLAIAAWLDRANRQTLLQQAWGTATRQVPPANLTQLVETMNRATRFDDWLKQAPSQSYRRQRLGFGVLSRHTEGTVPTDYPTVIENIPISQFFTALMPSFSYVPELDQALQPDRDAFLQKILPP